MQILVIVLPRKKNEALDILVLSFFHSFWTYLYHKKTHFVHRAAKSFTKSNMDEMKLCCMYVLEAVEAVIEATIVFFSFFANTLFLHKKLGKGRSCCCETHQAGFIIFCPTKYAFTFDKIFVQNREGGLKFLKFNFRKKD